MTRIGSGVEFPESDQTTRITKIGSGIFEGGDILYGQTSIYHSRVIYDEEPQLGGDLDLNERYIVYKEAPHSNLTASGLIVSLTYGESLLIGDFVYIKSDGAVWKAGADVVGFYPVMGIALETASSGSHKVLLHGIMRNDSWAWIVGSVVYLSLTPGIGTQVQPDAPDNAIQVLGIATHPDRIYFNPSVDYITHI